MTFYICKKRVIYRFKVTSPGFQLDHCRVREIFNSIKSRHDHDNKNLLVIVSFDFIHFIIQHIIPIIEESSESK